MPHRRDIDGLRALAILPVLLFHAGIPGFSGGYVGVDIFFVISGYLITGLIAGEMEEGRFSLLRFYERRARRILPALLVVMLVCLPFAHELLLPHEYRSFASSVQATLGFYSNVFFLGQSGYFADDVSTMPLLHTWTLAVEEQFYLVFPLLLLLFAAAWGVRSWRRAVAVLLLLSFAGAVYLAHVDADSAFYLGRGWELMLGAFLGVKGVPAPRSTRLATALGVAGLTMILAAVFLYEGATTFSPAAMLLPCVGAALIIHAGTGWAEPVGPANRLLATRLPVAIGLISYSLYLWHWPIIVFLQLGLMQEPLGAWAWLALGLSAGLSVLTWRYVEQPFRRRGAGKIPVRRLAMVLGGFAVVLFSAALAIRFSDGAPWRLPAQALEYLEVKKGRRAALGDCDGGDNVARTPDNCSIGVEGSAANVLLWGDSHARTLAATIEQLTDAADLGGIGLVRGGCPPLVGVDREDSPGECLEFGQSVKEYIDDNDVDVVVLHARWPMYVEGTRYGLEDGIVDLTGSDNAAVVRDKLGELIAYLKAKNIDVVLVGSVPEAGFDVANTLAIAAWRGDPDENLSIARKAVDARQARAAQMLRDLAQHYGVPLIEPTAALCDSDHCYLEREGESLYADEDHLSPYGVALLDPLLGPMRIEFAKAARLSRPPPERGAS